jgi:ribosome-binding factor A
MIPTMSRNEEGAGHRHTRLTQLLYEELSALVRDELADPRVEGARVVGVELSVDYRSARVRFVLDEPETQSRIQRALAGLGRATPFLRARLAEALDVKRAPDLRFIYDRDAAAAARAAKVMEKEPK